MEKGVFTVPDKDESPKVITLRIATVDKSQGDEADFVYLLTTRSNRGDQIGFVNDPNRVNVALSRSKVALTILGNKDTMSNGSEVWKKVKNFIYDRHSHGSSKQVMSDSL